MTSIVKNLHPLTDALGGELLHSPSMPWWIGSVSKIEQYQDIRNSIFQSVCLSAWAADGWEALSRTNLIRDSSVYEVRKALAYDEHKDGFVPIAILSAEDLVVSHAKTMTDAEARLQNERLANALSEGNLMISNKTLQLLGDGFGPGLSKDDGTPMRELMELRLDNGALILGFGWVWYRRGT